MKISECNWLQVETYLERDDRAVIPLGSTEQHAYLSLSVDSILSERVALEAAEPLGVPVFPVLAYGITPYFLAYPGTVSLRLETYFSVLRDLLDSLAGGGFKRILFVNGHGGNSPAQSLAVEWMVSNPDVRVKVHNWWNAPKTLEKVQETDPVASHASWMENFPWTRLPGIELPKEQKPMTDLTNLRLLHPSEVRDLLQEGSFGGYYERADDEMRAIWQVAVEETRGVLQGPWGR